MHCWQSVAAGPFWPCFACLKLGDAGRTRVASKIRAVLEKASRSLFWLKSKNPHCTQVSGTSESLSCLGSLCLWYILELIDTWISVPLRLSSLGTLKLSCCFSNSQSHCQTLSPPPSLIRFSSVHLAYINNICQTLQELLKLLWINHYHFPLFCLSLHKFVSKTIYPCQKKGKA